MECLYAIVSRERVKILDVPSQYDILGESYARARAAAAHSFRSLRIPLSSLINCTSIFRYEQHRNFAD